MRIVVLGLSLSSSWGNGHATTYRALLRALSARHEIVFLEREQPWYAQNRDLPAPDFCRLEFYHDLYDLERFHGEIANAEAVILGSYVPQGAVIAAHICPWVGSTFCFYDIDTPVTLAQLGNADYISRDTIPLFDIYFSFTGGPVLKRLEAEYKARRAVALYCGVDEASYSPQPVARRWNLGYMGTYSPDRQPALEQLLITPARHMPHKKFVVAGPMYPGSIDWPENVERIEHLAPEDHAAFYSAQAWTLNITRADMRQAGYSPSVRLFEAAACAAPVISDKWTGIERFFQPGKEIMLADGPDEVMAALAMPEARRAAIAQAARRHCLAAHTAGQRAAALEAAIFSPLADALPPVHQLTGTLL